MALYCGTSLQEIVIPNSVTKIDSRAFEYCSSLQQIVIPDSVKNMGYAGFGGCKQLSLITLPKVYKNISEVLFGYTGELIIKSVNSDYSYEDGLLINKKNKTLILYQSKSKKLVIPNGIKVIGESAFYDCQSLQEIVIPDSVRKIGPYAFKDCI